MSHLKPAARSGGPVTPHFHAPLGVQDADVDRALLPDAVLRQELLVFVDTLVEGLREGTDLLNEPRREVVEEAADPHAVERQARAAVFLEEIEDDLALAERVEEGRHRAEVDAGRREPEEVRRDALHLVEEHADVLRLLRHLEPEELLDREAVCVVVRGRRDVVHPVRVRDDHRVRLGLEQLLGAAVEVADVRARRDDALAVHLQDDAQDAVGGRVLRPEVQLHLPEAEEGVIFGLGRRPSGFHGRAHESVFLFLSSGAGPPPSG